MGRQWQQPQSTPGTQPICGIDALPARGALAGELARFLKRDLIGNTHL
jgi:hypothetical protein